MYVSEETINDDITWLLQNCLMTCGNHVLRQRIGVPMGTDCAPFLANLFLFKFEFEFMEKNHRTNFGLCRKLSRTFRYIDDLGCFNAGDVFQNVFRSIYPECLQLNHENTSSDIATFLDLDIKVADGVFNIKLYDKRNKFGFKIINFPDASGNVPQSLGRSVFVSQVLRLKRICHNFTNFCEEVSKIAATLVKQNFNRDFLFQSLQQLLTDRNEFQSFGLHPNRIAQDIFARINKQQQCS
mmetsp:Transcript_1512/g.2851  ORF Transcript_1512/g.2851 Transcript_1512/m.2851 type:complete len:240 (+) Transcript_1512:667-1386(+)